MIPLFTGEERQRRRINLGGISTNTSQEQLLAQARAVREERAQQRRQELAAVSLQRWWRAQLDRRRVRTRLQSEFDEDPLGINGMRRLALLKDDEDRLARWSEYNASSKDILSSPNSGPLRESWLVLMRQIAVQMMRSIARSPETASAFSFLKIITSLFELENVDVTLCQNIVWHLVQHDFYPLLKSSTENIPIEAKGSSSTLPLLVPLFTAPLSTFSADTGFYSACYVQTFQYILTIPLLPNRIPLQLLTQFSAQLPFYRLQLLIPSTQEVVSLPLIDTIHLLANLTMLVIPRLQTLPPDAFDAYLKISRLLTMRTPAAAFETHAFGSGVKQSGWAQEDEDSDDDEGWPQPGPSSAPAAPKKLPFQLDAKVRARLRTLGSMKTATTLLASSNAHPSTRLELYGFFIALYTVWPACRPDVLASVLANSNSGLLREFYRTYVRSSPIGKDDDPKTLLNPAHATAWLPLLFLIDLYTQALRTMNDDEFFASRKIASSSVSAIYRNPLTIDEVVAFSKQLLNIAFTLFWNESLSMVDWLPIPWETVRDKVTILLQAIHARDSRRPFTPPDHWLCISQLDMESFVEAAIFDDKSINMDEVTAPKNIRGRVLAKRLAHFSPRLGVLNNIPFAIPFETRVQIFRKYVESDMITSSGSSDAFFRSLTHRSVVTVRRGNVAADGFDRLGNVNLKGLIHIKFIDQFGQEEAGIDGGGVFKEFFTSLSKEVFDTARGLWSATKQNELYPNPISIAKEPHSLAWYRFVGRILGKALYEGILIDVAFAGFFLAKWLGRQSYLDDLASLDEELYKGLLFLKNYDGNPEDLSLTFAIVEDDLGIADTIDLIPNGSNIPVTKENRLQYINLISHYRLTKQIKLQSDAFFEGLTEMIEPKWIRMFNQQELQVLIGGVDAPIDLDDLRQHTQYGGSFKDEETTIDMFWRVVKSFDQTQRRALLRFATSCSRPPLLGFKELQPKFCIREAGTDQERLPTASTCVNLLKLPRYASERLLREKLLQAITSNAGFDLS